MSESVKTILFVLAGAVAIALAVVSQPSARTTDVQQFVGTMLNKDIDIAAPRRLQIARFDRNTAEVRQFEVAEVDGVWSIPSKDNYPADAVEQMAEAATCLIDRKILRVADESAMSHEKYGVVDPLSPKLDAKSVGVGTHVTMTDADNNKLVDMIIGKAVAGSPGQRYVRRASQNVVFVVELDPSKLSTNFENWIEDDLLKLNEMDLRQVQIDDYTADFSFGIGQDGRGVLQVARDLRAEMTLERDDVGSPWTVAKLLKGGPEDPPRYVDDQLAEDEEVNQQAVNDLVTGLKELLIVDVAKKPEGLSADLKAGQAFLTNNEALLSLLDKGFGPTPGQSSGAELIASEGEVVCTLRNGVVYELLFGQLQIDAESAAQGEDDQAAEEPAAEGADGADADAAETDPADPAAVDPAAATDDAATPASANDKAVNGDDQNMRRYLFVRARFDEDAVEKPQYKELPPLPEEDADDDAATDEGDAAATDADAGEESSEEAVDDDAASDEDGTENEGEAEDGAADSAGDEQAKAREAIEAERKQIEEENDRIREEYESLIAEGQEEVKVLNNRFGDWYFVISNDVYKKIHLGRDQVIKKKDAAEGESDGAADADGAAGMPELPESLIPGAPPAQGE